MGKYVLYGTVAFLVIILGMLFYPTVHANWSGIDVTGFIDLEKAGMVIMSYAFIFFFVYLVLAHIKK
jgi:hypothetical protein